MSNDNVLQSTVYVGSDKRYYDTAATRLLVLYDGKITEYNLMEMNKDRLFFGSSAECDIVIENDKIPQLLGKIKIENGRIFVGSMGGMSEMYLCVDNKYNLMLEKKYYEKKSGDMFIRATEKKDSGYGVVLVFTNNIKKAVWRQLKIIKEQITIGRDNRNDIVIDTPNCSRKHAVIVAKAGRYIIYDNHSTNGVFVNGERIENSMSVIDGDIIQLAGIFIVTTSGSIIYQSEPGGVSLTLHNVNKTVKSNGEKKRKILNHVFCNIDNNEFVAIIGGSGAGKTTVMNAMSGFDNDISGKVYCNGIDLRKNFSSLKNMIGFVPQQDIIYENLKLKRMLQYTAQLKMPDDITNEERDRRIQKVLKMVSLEEHAETYIRKLSGGQKKRASIAVELLANPGLFFLDEPTSGLDPDTEKSLMKTLAGLSKNEGKTIIMVTHTIQSIDLCDKVIFMAPGGKICYCGEPGKIYDYFGKKSLVEIYSELAANTDQWNQKYLYEYKQKNMEHMLEFSDSDSEKMAEIIKKSGRKTSALKQLSVLIKRYFELVFNDRQRLLLLLIQLFIIALLLKVVAKNDVFKIYDSTQSIMFALACSGIWIGLFNTIQEVCKERAILKREYMGNLRLWCYIVSKYVVQAVVCFIQTLILTGLFLLLMKHAPQKQQILLNPQMEIWLTIFLTIYASSALGLIVSSCVRNSDRAMALAPFVLIIQLLFSGVLFELKGAADKISYITVSRWSMECLGNITNLNKLDMKVAGMPHKHNDIYNRGAEHLADTWWILIIMTLICGVISIVVLRNLKNDTR